MTDYILTVAVSVAGGVLAIQSAFGFDSQWRVPLCLLLIAVMTVANLRGLRESGSLFAPPTYLYIVVLIILIVVGLYRVWFQDLRRSRSTISPRRHRSSLRAPTLSPF